MADLNLTQEKMDIMADFTKNLPELRKSFKVSQTILGKKVGLSRQTISSIERGTVPMTWNIFLSVVVFFCANDNAEKKFVNKDMYSKYLNDMLLIDKQL